MRISILTDNHSLDERYKAERGFSCHIAFGGHEILFDTGISGAALDNAAAMGVDLSRVKFVVLSHAHFDHVRGFLRFAEQGYEGYKLLVHRSFFTHKYIDRGDTLMYIGNAFSPEFLWEKRIPHALIKTDLYPLEEENAADFLMGNIGRHADFEAIDPSFFKNVAGAFVPDDFCDELAYVAVTSEGLVIVTGCGHNGIVNTCEEAVARFHRPVCAVIGGTHLMSAAADRTEATIRYFNAHPEIRLVAACHCTGEEAGEAFAARCRAYRPIGAGAVIELTD